MPKGIESEIRKSAAKAGKTGEEADRYVYGALNNKGLMHGNKETAKGAKAEAKFEKDPKHRGAPKDAPEGSAKEEASESASEARAEGDDPVTKRKKKQKARAKAVVTGQDPDAAEAALGYGDEMSGQGMGGGY